MICVEVLLSVCLCCCFMCSMACIACFDAYILMNVFYFVLRVCDMVVFVLCLCL